MNHTLLILMYTVTMFVAVVQSLSHVQLFVTSWTTARQVPLSSTISRSLLRFRCIESVMLSNHLSIQGRSLNYISRYPVILTKTLFRIE